MKPIIALVFVLLPGIPAVAGPVHVALKPSAALTPDASDFFCLGSVATLSGGNAALRTRLAAVSVGRDPLPGDVRHLTPGDLMLKMRQAGFHPSQDIVLDGASESDITVSSLAPPVPNSGGARLTPPLAEGEAGWCSSAPSAGGAIIVHPGDPITIRIDDGPITVTATGIAETSGATGDDIRVRREGVASALDATVLDSQTVELEF